ncbi:MAG: hypothetical protein H0Z38_09165 [Firmicutes bacterium]|nr:hypothetical protein [Bacillota bacterium]
MISQNQFSRVVLLLTVLSLLQVGNTRLEAKDNSEEFRYLLYPYAIKTQVFDTEFNFQRHLIAMQYTKKSPAAVCEYYKKNMPKWGWVPFEDPSVEQLRLGFESKGDAVAFEKDGIVCNILALTKIDENFHDTLISLEVTDKPAQLKEEATVEAIAKEIAPIPIFPGASEAVIFKSTFPGARMTVSYETPFSIEQVVDYYRKHMSRLGYVVESAWESTSSEEEFSTTMYYKGDKSVVVGVSRGESGKASVLLILNLDEEAQTSSSQISVMGLSA